MAGWITQMKADKIQMFCLGKSADPAGIININFSVAGGWKSASASFPRMGITKPALEVYSNSRVRSPQIARSAAACSSSDSDLGVLAAKPVIVRTDLADLFQLCSGLHCIFHPGCAVDLGGNPVIFLHGEIGFIQGMKQAFFPVNGFRNPPGQLPPYALR